MLIAAILAPHRHAIGPLLASVSVSALVGCARTESPAPVGEPPDPNVYARGICNWFARCKPAFVRSNFGDVASCATAITRGAATRFSTPGVSVSKRALDACIVRTESASCDDEIEALPECDLRGTLSNGAACLTGIACASGSCFRASEGEQTCGICTQRAAERESCAKAACAPGLDCVSGQCLAPAAVGSTCTAEHRCRGNLACLNGTCVAPRGRDEPCDHADSNAVPCDEARGLVCDATKNVCAAYLAPKGGSCQATPFCEASVCVNGTCLARLLEGETCQIDADVGCAYPLECRDGKCADVATCD